ncbi:MAG: hypothetical protein H0T11_01145 [Chthoniobacterales bacterium]|nr:hypothetical protein [Chthoniobacterales bacterium]
MEKKTGRRNGFSSRVEFSFGNRTKVRIPLVHRTNYLRPPFFAPLLALLFLLAAFFFAGALEPDFLEDDFFAGIVYPPFQSADAVGVNNFVNKFTTTCE